MVDGININQEDADQEYLPDDLNSLAVGSYVAVSYTHLRAHET